MPKEAWSEKRNTQGRPAVSESTTVNEWYANKVLWSTSWGKPKGEPNQEIYWLQDFIGLRSRDLSGVLDYVAALPKLRWPQNTYSEWNLLTFQWNECSKIELGKHWCKSVATKGENKFKRVWMVIIWPCTDMHGLITKWLRSLSTVQTQPEFFERLASSLTQMLKSYVYGENLSP